MEIASGWRPDQPDDKDYLIRDHTLPVWPDEALEKVSPEMDLSAEFPPVRDQGPLPTCTAFAVCGLMDWVARMNPEIEDLTPSPRFVFHAAMQGERRRGRKTAKDVRTFAVDPAAIPLGLNPRSALMAFLREGVATESACPYPTAGSKQDRIKALATPISKKVYRAANRVAGMKAVRFDPGDGRHSSDETLKRVKHFLWNEAPCTIGFSFFENVLAELNKHERGAIPYPAKDDTPLGSGDVKGHAALIVGYDDAREVPMLGGGHTTGAFLIRNSWGDWFQGDDCKKGYGWLPYAYLDPVLAPKGAYSSSKVTRHSPLAGDVWAIMWTEWEDKKITAALRKLLKELEASGKKGNDQAEAGAAIFFALGPLLQARRDGGEEKKKADETIRKICSGEIPLFD